MNLINLKMNLKHKMWENLKESSNFVNALYMLTLSVSFAHSLCLPPDKHHTQTHTHAHTPTTTHTHPPTQTHTHSHTLTHSHTHSHTHTQTHTHTHTHTHSL